MMKGELQRFSRRELANVIAFSDSDEFKSTVVMLKLMQNALILQNMVASRTDSHDLDLLTGGGGRDAVAIFPCGFNCGFKLGVGHRANLSGFVDLFGSAYTTGERVAQSEGALANERREG